MLAKVLFTPCIKQHWETS